MTVHVKFGRRRPKSWRRRMLNTVKGLLSFQENIWIIIKQQMRAAAKKANSSGKDIKIHYNTTTESEDEFWELEWFELTIVGSKAMEEEEHEEANNMYKKFGKMFKKDVGQDPRLSKTFTTKRLPLKELRDAYQKGYGSVDNNNISNKLLEMGILTHIKLLKDWDTREVINIDE